MKLSKREWMIYDAISSEGRGWSAEDIAELIWCEKPMPKSWRSRVGEIMVLLCAKTKALGMSPAIERTSKLGRGSQATYEARNN